MSAVKDAFYFPHDSNAKDDPKIVFLIEELGLEGYGIYWVLLETLRDQPDYQYPVKLIPALARRFLTTEDKVAAVVKDFELFESNSEIFYSPALIRRMNIVNTKRTKQSEAGKRGREKQLQAQAGGSPGVAQATPGLPPGKESKEKKKKEKSIVANSDTAFYKEVIAYLNERIGTRYRPSTANTQRLIKARLSEGFSLSDFKTVIDSRVEKWSQDPKMSDYLRPATLFSTKFESYLQSAHSLKLSSQKDCNTCDYQIRNLCDKTNEQRASCTAYIPDTTNR